MPDSIAELVAETAARARETRRLVFAPAFRGYPGTVHGGAIAGIVDAILGLPSPRRLRVRIRQVVPTDQELVASVEGATCVISDPGSGAPLVEAAVDRLDRPSEDVPPASPTEAPMPLHRQCFACGRLNEASLKATFQRAGVGVVGEWAPSERFMMPDRLLDSIVLTTLVDEAASWAGAVASGMVVVTPSLEIELGEGVPASRIRVCAEPEDRGRQSSRGRAIAVLHDEAGNRVASGRVMFVGHEARTRVVVRSLLEDYPRDVVAAIFPQFVGAADTG